MKNELFSNALYGVVGAKGVKYLEVKMEDLTSTVNYLFANVDRNRIQINGDYFDISEYSFPKFVNDIINLGFITLTSSTKTNLVKKMPIDKGNVLTPFQVKQIFDDLSSLGCPIETAQLKTNHVTISGLKVIPIEEEGRVLAFPSGGDMSVIKIAIADIRLNLNECADGAVPIEFLIREGEESEVCK